MRLRAAFTLSLVFGLLTNAWPARAVDLVGAGSTFVFPLMAKWTDAYFNKTGVKVNYQSIGSGGGIKQIEGRTVDFGTSDMPLDLAKLTQAKLVQFALVRGEIVPVVHLSSIEPNILSLDGGVLADIFLNVITQWNDPKIQALNPQLNLPDLGITVVHRSDGSGTTFTWTQYLGQNRRAWAEQVGQGTAVRWPNGVGGKGNEGVAAFVKRIEGSIGYVEAAFVRAGHLKAARLPEAVRATTYVLLPKDLATAPRGRVVIRFLNWALREGDTMARALGYTALETPEQNQIFRAWQRDWPTLKVDCR